MSDKLRDLTPVSVNWSSGEQPTAAKLQGWADQIANGFRRLEEVLGDPYSDSHPLFVSGNTLTGGYAFARDGTSLGSAQRHLQITNLARLIGPASALNPRILSANTPTLTEAVPGGQNTFHTRYRPITNVSMVATLANVFSSLKANASLVYKFGDYYVDEANGVVTYIGAQSGSVGTITYDVDLSAAYGADTYEDATFNVIPDPNQATKCAVTGPSGGRYTFTLPTATDQQSDWDELSPTLDSTEDPNYLQQLTLPTAWNGEFTSGDEIPDGMIKIWDDTDSVFLEGQLFFYVSQTVVEVDDSITLDTGSTRYSLVVIGTDITRTLDTVRTKLYKHEHSGDDGSQRLDHRYLTGMDRGYFTLAEIGGGTTITAGWTRNSSATNHNDHPQYLHRKGADNSELRNAMFGSLLMAPLEYDDGTNGWAPPGVDTKFYDGSAGQDDSYTAAIYFGSNSGKAPYIRGDYQGSADGAILNLTANGASSYTLSSSDGAVIRAVKRIVLDNTDDTSSIQLNSGGDTEITAVGAVDLSSGGNTNIKHNSGDVVRVFDSTSTVLNKRGGRLEVKGDSNTATSHGIISVEGKIAVTVAGSGATGDGEIHATQGFCTPAGAGGGLAMFAKSVSDTMGAMPDSAIVPLSTITDLGQLRGIQVMVRLNSTDEWFGPNDNANRGYYYKYDVSANDIYIYFTGSDWASVAIVIDVVGTYNPA